MIAFGNCSPINRTLIFIFQSRSRLRAIKRKNQSGKTPFSDVNPQYFFNHILIENDEPINHILNAKFSSTLPSRLKIFQHDHDRD